MSKAAKREKKRGKKGRHAQSHAQTAVVASSGLASSGPAPSTAAAQDEVDVELSELASPVAEPPPFEHATRTKSGYAPRMHEPPRVDDDTLTDHLVSLQPLYRATDGKGERAAELEVEDLSLRLEGSFLGSPLASLPAAPVRPLGARIVRAVGVVFLATSSSFGVWSAVQLLRSSDAPIATRVEVAAPQPAVPQGVAAQPLPEPLPELAPVADDAKPDEPAAAPELVSAAEATGPGSAAVAEPIDPTSAKPAHARAPRGAVEPASAAHGLPSAEVPAPTLVASPEAAAAAATAVAPTEALPKRPSPAAVRASFGQLRPTMSACAPGRQGLVTLRVVVAGTGRVTSGTVEGQFQSPEERACMTRAILDLRLPPFQQDAFEIAYPLSL